MDEGRLPPPPIVVGIVGPPGVGKSTLLRSLVRRFTKHNLNEPQGPITVVSGKTRRITFVECGNDLNSMIDLGKVVDLVLLMIDGSFGFEMVRTCRSTAIPPVDLCLSNVQWKLTRRKHSNSSTSCRRTVSPKFSVCSRIST